MNNPVTVASNITIFGRFWKCTALLSTILLISGIYLLRITPHPVSIATTHSPTTEAAQSDHLDFLKNMTTSDLAQVVLSNCRLTQYLQPAKQSNIKNAATIVQESYANTATGSWNKTISILEKIVSKVRQKKNYRWPPVYNQKDNKFYAYCLNTKSGSTFLRREVLKNSEWEEFPRDKNYTRLVNAFMVIREPMHRLLSAYLNKVKKSSRRTNKSKTFSENIALYIRGIGKTTSNLYSADLKSLRCNDVTFSDFVDYIIYMYLRNDGKVDNPIPDVETSDWMWRHWASVVNERCYPCSAIWHDVVLFENFETHLRQVHKKYPSLFLDESKLPEFKLSKTGDKLKQYYDQISDSQLWFLGRVMYNIDYAILPYYFSDFLRSIGREDVLH
ncbi:uncharacterized protein LOC142353646 [Convolutriloba macropyga]|uniref:uncharacterized protein LOC142353646 n=1 Tax=Convolutriloba macropyga TaxID=536237 RepID=UPI003F51BBFF